MLAMSAWVRACTMACVQLLLTMIGATTVTEFVPVPALKVVLAPPDMVTVPLMLPLLLVAVRPALLLELVKVPRFKLPVLVMVVPELTDEVPRVRLLASVKATVALVLVLLTDTAPTKSFAALVNAMPEAEVNALVPVTDSGPVCVMPLPML